jgi:hypothetical protein
MKPSTIIVFALAGLMAISLSATSMAKSPKMKMTTPIPPEITTPDKVETRIGTLNFKYGMPDKSTIEKVYDNLDFIRAVDVYLNALPGVSLYANRKGMKNIGVADNTLVTMEQMCDSTGMFLTPNTVTPQTWPFLNLKKRPLVVELPPKVLGLADDMWFRYITDLGFLGPDKGKGGKYLFLPPDYKGEVPEGYFVVKSPTYGVWIPFRNFAVDGDVKPALESLKKHMRIYPLSEAGKDHGEVPNKNGSFVRLNTIPPNTYVFYEYLAALVQEEPAGSFGPEITGQMAAIGIEKGKKFQPDERMKKILTEAVAVGNATARAVTFASRNDKSYFYGKESAWFTPFVGGSEFLSNGARRLDARTTFHYFATGITPAMAEAGVGKGSVYACGAKDAKGNWLDGGKTYKLTLPPNIPQENFWSMTVYDSQTRSLLQTDYAYPAIGSGKGFPKAGSPNGAVQQNKDGSTDIYFGPKPPAGKKANWIQTVPGRGWCTILRLYSPKQPWFDKTWRPGKIELVK